MIEEKLRKEIDFIVEIDKMKSTFRRTSLINGTRKENDAEHSWHLSLMTMLLSEYADNDIDVSKVIKMVLVHDLVEIYAGDTFCYDKVGNSDKHERELKSADKLFSILPEEKGKMIRELWEEFEDMKTNEAIFANSMDRLEPFLVNYYTEGGTWKEYNISKEQVYKRSEPIKKSSEQLWKFTQDLIEDAHEKGYIPR